MDDKRQWPLQNDKSMSENESGLSYPSCSLITVNSTANNFFRSAVAILFLLTSKHTSSTVAAVVVHGNNVRDSRLRDVTCFPFIAR